MDWCVHGHALVSPVKATYRSFIWSAPNELNEKKKSLLCKRGPQDIFEVSCQVVTHMSRPVRLNACL